MIRYRKKITIYIIPILIFTACQETYDPNLQYRDVNIPAIEAVLTDKPGKTFVKISWLAEFEQGYNHPVTDAAVNIMDTNKNITAFIHDNNGLYLPTDTTFFGKIGNAYKLEVTFPDGEVYGSPLVKLKKAAVIDTMYAEIGLTDVVTTNTSGETIIEEKPGLSINYNMSSSNVSRQYYLLTSKVLYQYRYDVFIPPTTEIIVYMWRGEYAYDVPKIEMSETRGKQQVAMNLNAGFLIYEWDHSTRSTDRSGRRVGSAYPQGWIVQVTCQVVNEKTYDFYNNLSSQLLSEDHIFDAVPYQIVGNIHCLSDTNKITVGNFNVGPTVKETYGFYWAEGGEVLLSKKIKNRDFPIIKGNTSEDVQEPMPDFWYEYTSIEN